MRIPRTQLRRNAFGAVRHANSLHGGNRQQQFNAWHVRFRDDLLELIAQANSGQGVTALTTRIRKAYGEKSARGLAASMAQAADRQRAAQRIVIPGAIASAAGAAAGPSIGIASQTPVWLRMVMPPA